MELHLRRDLPGDTFTLGQLHVDGEFECYTLEDQERPDGEKIHGRTAIPEGRYRVAITMSPRFRRRLPLLFDVNNFDGIRIHPGNTADDTEGCILPGRSRVADRGIVSESRLAFDALFAKIQAGLQDGGEVWIEITSS